MSMMMPEPFDPDYTATNFVGFSLSVDLVSADRTLGANWQSIDMGSMSLQSQDLYPGGFSRSRFQMIGDLTYENVTLSRPWTPNQSGWIPQWFAAAAQQGPSSVSIAINYLDVRGTLQQAIYNFRDAYPVSWNQPHFYAGAGSEFSTESLTFSHSGFVTSDNLTPGIDDPESVEPFRLVVMPGGADNPMSSALSTLTSWTAGGDTWVPPTSISVSKQGGWGQPDQVPDAIGSGPVQWLGTNPLTIDFDYILDSALADSRQGGNSQASSVLPDVERLLALMEVDPLMAMMGVGTSPMVMVLWGDFTSPVSYVQNVTADFTQFDSSGRPTRATGHIQITQYPPASLPTNPTSGGDLPRRSQEVYYGDQLAHVSFRAYKNLPDSAALPRRGESGRPVGAARTPDNPRGTPRKGAS